MFQSYRRYNILRRYPYKSILEHFYKTLSHTEKAIVLGIETSCDDTGCAVLDGSGNILGESLFSQNEVHVRYGGVNPVVAYDLHRENIELAANQAITKANLTFADIDAIAVTTKPGLLISLQVGVKYARYLSRIHNKPLIPIHHMEAHTLVTRMYYDIPFPFMVLLISGGHCLLAVVNDVTDFLLLGESLDNAPGEVMDKAARRMKLKNIPAYSNIPGGKAIEQAAKHAINPMKFEFPLPLSRKRDCNFSFSGLKDFFVRRLIKKESEHNIMGDGIIPEVNDLCASFQIAIAEHLVHRTIRAIYFCEERNLIQNKNIVISGGVACNDFIFRCMQHVGAEFGYQVYRPPPRLCTDNGVMIAWNGIEKLRKQCGIVSNINLNDIDPKAPLGRNLINEVEKADIPVKVMRLKNLFTN